jgi:hypothetical protein
MRLQDDQNEEEAQRKRQFLERGAPVRVEPVQRYEPVRPRMVVPRALTVELPGTEELASELAQDDNHEAMISLEFAHLGEATDFSVLVFVNTPRAGADTPTTAPGFVGAVAFFHGQDQQHTATTAQLPARGAIERSETRGPLNVTLLPVGFPDRRISARELDVTATVELVRSEVG